MLNKVNQTEKEGCVISQMWTAIWALWQYVHNITIFQEEEEFSDIFSNIKFKVTLQPGSGGIYL